MSIVDYQPERRFWNVAKGIGILAIIIGHACKGYPANFVYMFHIQFFFFISGYLYCEKKYGDDPWLNMKNKIKSLWLPYFLIIAFFVIFHNIFLMIGMQISDTPSYSLTEILVRVAQGMFGQSEEILAGPAWFLRTLAITMIIFGFIVAASRLLERKTNIIVKIIFQLICVVALTVVGYPLVANHIQLPADMQIGFEMLPFVWVGYILRNYVGDISKYLNIFVAVACFAIVTVVSCFNTTDYAMGQEFPYMHVVAFAGIYGCLYITKLIRKWDTSTKVLELYGQLSLYIMFIHFVILRAIDRILCIIYNDVNAFDQLSVSFTNMWWLYLIITIPLSLLVAWLLKKCIDGIKKICK